MKAIDQYGMPLRRNTRRKTKQPSNVMFKLRDPITGMFWGVSSPKEPVFNHVGKQWGSRQGAMSNWAEYNFQRVVEDDQHPRELELVEYALKVTEKGATSDKSPDMTVAALFAVTYKLDYDLNKFVKKLSLDGYRFSHLIKCEKTGSDFPLPPHVSFRYQYSPLNGFANGGWMPTAGLLVDEATGQFWTGVLRKGATMFSETGVEYRTAKAATEAFLNYEVTRVGQPARALPVVKKVIYRVSIEEVAREEFEACEADLRLARFANIYGKETRLCGFVRHMHADGVIMDFAHIVQRNPKASVDISALTLAKISSRKSGKKFIAVRSDADLLYLKMQLGDDFANSYDLATGAASIPNKPHT